MVLCVQRVSERRCETENSTAYQAVQLMETGDHVRFLGLMSHERIDIIWRTAHALPRVFRNADISSAL